MKLLIDSCVWAGAVPALRAAGHDVDLVAAWPSDPGDEEILAAAFAGGRTVITFDKDFGVLAVFKAQPHCGIVRLIDMPAQSVAEACLAALRSHGDALLRGAIVTVRRDRMRLRPP